MKMNKYTNHVLFGNIFFYIALLMAKPVFDYNKFVEILNELIKNPINVDTNTTQKAKDAVDILSTLSSDELKKKFIEASEILDEKRYIAFEKEHLRVAWVR